MKCHNRKHYRNEILKISILHGEKPEGRLWRNATPACYATKAVEPLYEREQTKTTE